MVAHQTTMFDQTTDAYGNVNVSIARRDDPVTSKIAAASVAPKLTGLRKDFVRGLELCGGSATSLQAAEAVCKEKGWTLHKQIESVRKRAGECVKAGAVKLAGTDKVDGNECSVYELVKGDN